MGKSMQLNPMKSLTWIIDTLMGRWERYLSWSLRATTAQWSFSTSFCVSVWHVTTSPTKLSPLGTNSKAPPKKTTTSEQLCHEHKSPAGWVNSKPGDFEGTIKPLTETQWLFTLRTCQITLWHGVLRQRWNGMGWWDLNQRQLDEMVQLLRGFIPASTRGDARKRPV